MNRNDMYLSIYIQIAHFFQAPGSTCVSSFHRCDGYLSVSAVSSGESSTPRLRIRLHSRGMDPSVDVVHGYSKWILNG